METTSRRFDCTKVCWAASPCSAVRRSSRRLAGVSPFGAEASWASASRPASMAWARRTSSSFVSSGYWPMSVRYSRTRSSSSRSSRSFANFTGSFVFPTGVGAGLPDRWDLLGGPAPRCGLALTGATIAAFEVYRTRQDLRSQSPFLPAGMSQIGRSPAVAAAELAQSSGTESGNATSPCRAPAATTTDSRCCWNW